MNPVAGSGTVVGSLCRKRTGRDTEAVGCH
jgi:hypothetical protein